MSASIGDGITAIALAGGIVGYLYVQNRTIQKRNEIIHQERMAAMEKGIPLPEFSLDPARDNGGPDQRVLPILGIVLLTLSIGAMVFLYFDRSFLPLNAWISPLPFAFLGVGLLAFHLLQTRPPR